MVRHQKPEGKNSYNVTEFIQKIFFQEYNDAINGCYKFHYLSFPLIAIGTEFLGACLDKDYEFTDDGRSKERFNIAINKLFPKEYRPLTSELYTHWRCGFIHQMRPGKNIEVTHRAESKREHKEHLKRSGKKLTLVCEDLYKDFVKACNKLIVKIKNEKLEIKLYGQYIRIK